VQKILLITDKENFLHEIASVLSHSLSHSPYHKNTDLAIYTPTYT